ncbi:MAG: hypothetical protein H0V70_09405 [Ktedonobacteraceae bacterium]|nr:hypothetical protein [Ktedonobacteraceae bacterium]
MQNAANGNGVAVSQSQASSPGHPKLERLEQVTDQAFGQEDNYVPNSWGVHKNRIVRTSSGDIFTTYTSEGDGKGNRQWHLMHRSTSGNWDEVKSGNAGTEPINILRGPHDEIHVFAWPGDNGILNHFVSTNQGRSFKEDNIPGKWISQDQGYAGSGTNAKGNIVIFQTGNDKPGVFVWSYYNPDTQKWQFHTTTIDYRYTYAFFLPGDNNDLTITAMRDVHRQELNYPTAPDGQFDYIFNAIKYFYIKDVTQQDSQLIQKVITDVQPKSDTDHDITYIVDTYIDTSGHVHILYDNQYDGGHHAILANGQVIKDVRQNIDYAVKMRITQDSKGHFYIISTSQDGKALNVYPGIADDTDGTQLEPPTKLDISQFPGCEDYDFCHLPTFTVPRNGHALSDTIDGTYGNHSNEIYFRINLRGTGTAESDLSSQEDLVRSEQPPLPIAVREEKALMVASLLNRVHERSQQRTAGF